MSIIFFSLYILTMGGALIICYKKELFWIYCRVRKRKMRHLFPEYPDWEQGDKILYHKNEHNDDVGHLKAMSDDAIIVTDGGNTREIKAFQIMSNMDYDTRKKKQKYEEFHNDILPLLCSGEPKFDKEKLLN